MKTPLSWLAAVVAALALAPAKPLAKAEKQPNIIFFLSDDHRWDRLGSAGHPFLKTPTLDRLAKEGVRFSNMFVTTSICAASRATILTGLYERTPVHLSHLPDRRRFSQASYPVPLRKAGYKTGFIGKFGVNVQQQDREASSTFPADGRRRAQNNGRLTPSRASVNTWRARLVSP